MAKIGTSNFQVFSCNPSTKVGCFFILCVPCTFLHDQWSPWKQNARGSKDTQHHSCCAHSCGESSSPFAWTSFHRLCMQTSSWNARCSYAVTVLQLRWMRHHRIHTAKPWIGFDPSRSFSCRAEEHWWSHPLLSPVKQQPWPHSFSHPEENRLRFLLLSCPAEECLQSYSALTVLYFSALLMILCKRLEATPKFLVHRFVSWSQKYCGPGLLMGGGQTCPMRILETHRHLL